jgi:hypothetical protein
VGENNILWDIDAVENFKVEIAGVEESHGSSFI